MVVFVEKKQDEKRRGFIYLESSPTEDSLFDALRFL